MSVLLELIKQKREELTVMVLNGRRLDEPEVLRKSQELDKLVTTYYKDLLAVPRDKLKKVE